MRRTTRVSLTEAKQHLGELVKRAAYGDERFVVEFRGKPQVTIDAYRGANDDETLRAKQTLEKLARLRKSIEARTGIQPDSAEMIRELREERDRQLMGDS